MGESAEYICLLCSPKIWLSPSGNYTTIESLFYTLLCTEVFHGEEVVVRFYSLMLCCYFKTCPRAAS